MHDALTDLERKTLPAAEEDAAAEADRARPRINREEAEDAAVSAKRRKVFYAEGDARADAAVAPSADM